MNIFTKEELETIYLDMNHIIIKYGKENVAPFYLELRDKVEKMIKNHCEHEWENICCQCDMHKIYCYKCERTLDDNQ